MIDAHLHLITKEMVLRARERFENLYPGYAHSLKKGGERLFNKEFMDFLSNRSLKELADDWIREFDENGIEHAIFFPISEELEQMRDFVQLAPDRFSGYAILDDPKGTDAPDKLRRAVKEYGLKGLKLYPSLHFFHANEKGVFPLYEEAQELGIPITFHFGISNAPLADYRYTNPLDLQLPLKLFPDVKFIVAHFGAGFFREICLLGFHNKNLYLDSSGTNNWREYLPKKMELDYIFKRSVEIFSASRILFGTDTVLKGKGSYRSAIKEEQKQIIESIGLTPEERENIMGGNAKRLFLKD